MYKLKMVKGRSYRGVVYATVNRPFVEVADEATANVLVKSGFFELIEAAEENTSPEKDNNEANNIEPDAFLNDAAEHEAAAAPEDDTPEEAELAAKVDMEALNLNAMDKSELIAFAETHGIDLSECKNNGERRMAIEAALSKEA